MSPFWDVVNRDVINSTVVVGSIRFNDDRSDSGFVKLHKLNEQLSWVNLGFKLSKKI